MANAPEAQNNESMEDILHSIRRIIANEPEGAADGEEALELTEVVGEVQTAEDAAGLDDAFAQVTAAMDAEPEVVIAAPPPPPPPPPPLPPVQEAVIEMPSPPQPAQVAPAVAADSLIAETTAEASAMALRHLVDSIPKPQVDSMLFRSGATLEALVVESIKPMLADWLNKNLPTLVQSIVEKEIRKLLPKE